MNINDSFASRYSFITDILRSVFLFIDGAIYNLIQPIFGVVIRLSNITELLKQEDAARLVADKIYVFLALLMFFKLAFSIITMIANPDAINDKQKGLSKMFSHAVITVVLIVAVPSLFRAAYSVQDLVLEKGFLRNIFGSSSEGKYIQGNEGQKIATDTFKIFFKESGLMGQNWKITEHLPNYDNPLNTSAVADILNEYNPEGKYFFTYIMGFSTIVGVILVISFVTMAIEIGIRSIKLFLLQIVSPIAIISYLDPASASKGIFAKWLALTMKTYLSLFIRLGTLYFLVSLLANFEIKDDIHGFGWLESLFFILAILSFMKSGPKMIEELFGYKPSEDGKAIKEIMGGAIGLGVGAAYSGIQGARVGASERTGFRKFTSGLGGAAKGMAKGGLSGAAAGKKGGVLGAYNQNKKNFQSSEGYKKLQQAKGQGDAEKAATNYKGNTPDWETNDPAFQLDANSTAVGDHNAITGSNAAALKALYRKNEAEKIANNKTFGKGSTYADAKNKVADNKLKRTLKADEARQSELSSQKAAAKREASSATKLQLDSRIKERADYKTDLERQRDSQRLIIADTTRTPDEHNRAVAEEAMIDGYITGVSTEISTLNASFAAATAQETADNTAWLTSVDTATTDKASLEKISADFEKSKAVFDSMQKEPKYSREAEIDQKITRAANF